MAQWGALGPELCSTRYPLMLLHGLGYRDDMKLLSAWGRIPDVLRQGGAQVFLGDLEAWGSLDVNARALKVRVEQILAETGAGKINLLAHSKGGLEARYLISHLGMGEVVASLTTLCTPHGGTSVADRAEALPLSARELAFRAVDGLARWMGDRQPDGASAVQALSRAALRQFNQETPDDPRVFYQSVGAQVHRALDEPFFALSYALVHHVEGENDGVVSTHSCPWGVFRGILSGDESRGLSHLDLVDFYQRTVSGTDIPRVYAVLVAELKRLGY